MVGSRRSERGGAPSPSPCTQQAARRRHPEEHRGQCSESCQCIMDLLLMSRSLHGGVAEAVFPVRRADVTTVATVAALALHPSEAMLRSSAGALCASSLSALLLVLLAGFPARASASAASGSPAPELFVHPSPFPPAYTAASDQPIVLTAPQTNALLAHHLGVEHHVNWPLPATTTTSSAAAGSRDWELALEQPTLRNAGESDSITTRRRVVVVLECGKPGCTEAIPLHLRPEANSGQRPLVLPALPPTSYLAAVSLHLHRLVDAVPGLEPEHVQGLERLVQSGIKAVRGWQGWVSEELGNWIGWHDGEVQVEPQVEPEWPGKAGLVSELDLLDGVSRRPAVVGPHLFNPD